MSNLSMRRHLEGRDNAKTPKNTNTNTKTTSISTKSMRQYVEKNGKMELRSGDGKNFGQVSLKAYNAVKGGYLDKYSPANEHEKQVLDEYKRIAVRSRIKPTAQMAPSVQTREWKNNLLMDIYSERKAKAESISNAFKEKYGISLDEFGQQDYYKWATENGFKFVHSDRAGLDDGPILSGNQPSQDIKAEEKKLRTLLQYNNRRNEIEKSSGKSGAMSAFSYGSRNAITFNVFDRLSAWAEKKLLKSDSGVYANALNENYKITIDELNKNLRSEHPTAYNSGEISGNVVSLVAIDNAVGAALGGFSWFNKLASKAPQIASAIKSGMVFGTNNTLNAIGAGNKTKDVVRQGALGTLGGAAGGAVSATVGGLIENGLYRVGWQNKIVPEIVRNAISSSAFATADTGVTYFLRPKNERPNKEEIIKNVETAFIFGAITGAIEVANITAESKATIERLNDRLTKSYQSMAAAVNASNPEEIAKFANEVISSADTMIEYLDGKGIELKESAPTTDAEAYLVGKTKRGYSSEKNRMLEKARFVGADKEVRTLRGDLVKIKERAENFLNRSMDTPDGTATDVGRDVKTLSSDVSTSNPTQTQNAKQNQNQNAYTGTPYSPSNPVATEGKINNMPANANDNNAVTGANTNVNTNASPTVFGAQSNANLTAGNSELDEIQSADAIEQFAPQTASNEIKRLERIVISRGASDVSRQKIVSSAISVEKALQNTDKPIRSVFESISKITNETVSKIGKNTGNSISSSYWDLFADNISALSSGNYDSLISEYSEIYAATLKDSNPEQYNSVFVGKDGMDLTSQIPKSIQTQSIPPTVKNAGEYGIAIAQIKSAIDNAATQINALKKDIYPTANSNNSPTPKNIHLTKMGMFYEAFGDDAVELSNKLGFTLTTKNVNGERIPMVGFPVADVENYRNRLGSGYEFSIDDTDNTSLQNSEHIISNDVTADNDMINHAKESVNISTKAENGEVTAAQSTDNVKDTKAKKKIIKAKKSDWSSHDVYWYAPNSKIVIAYSTKSASDLIEILAQDNPTMTIAQVYDNVTYDTEAKKVLQAYIDSGFGDETASDHFGKKAEQNTPKTEQNTPKTEQNTPKTEDTPLPKLTDKCELIKTVHTKTNEDLWVITLKDKLSADDYKELNKKVKAIGGYYSRFAKTPDGKSIPGFVFKSEPTAKEIKVFNDFFDDVDNVAPENNAEPETDNEIKAPEKEKTPEKVLSNQPENDTISVAETETNSETNDKEAKEKDVSEREILDRESSNDDRGLRSGAEKENTSETTKLHEQSGDNGELSVSGDNERNASRPTDGNDGKRADGGVYSADAPNRVGKSDTGGVDTETTDTETIDTSPIKEKRPSNKNNFIITDDIAQDIDNTLPSASDNLEAISLLLKLEDEGRPATAEEKKILAKYKGWGGIDISRLDYNLYTQVYKLFDREQINAMRSSQNNAFYTPTKVIDAMYAGLKKMGFKGGNVLESSMGIGNFFGRMPTSMSSKSALTGVELESYTARIAQYLYPGATVINKPFQDVAIKNGSFDLVIGNVPFGNNYITYNKKKYVLHNYFILSSLDKVRDGGIVAVITSAGTLDSGRLDTRKAIMDKADVVACYKLPAGVFSRNAKTDVQTDLLILRKRASNEKPSGDSILNTITTADGLKINEYFDKHPENILGTLEKGTNAWGEITTVKDDGNFYEKLDKAMSKLPKGLISGKTELKPIETIVSLSDRPRFFEKKGKVYADDGADTATEVSEAQNDTVRDYIKVRDAYKELLSAYEYDLSEDEIKPLRNTLAEAYDTFTKKHGAITGDGKKKIGSKKCKNNTFLEADADYYLVGGLEHYNATDKKFEKSALFDKDTLRKKKVDKVRLSSDALAVALNETGKIDFERMSELTGKTEKELAEDLKGEIVYTPDGNYELTDIYLSGNIYEKIDAVKDKPEFREQLKMLESVLPTPKKASQITIKLGANYISTEYITDFAREVLGTRLDIRKDSTGKWVIEGVKQHRYGELLNTKYGCSAFNGVQLLEKVLNDSEIVATRTVKIDGKSTSVFDEKMTEIAKQKAEDIKTAFESWIFKNTDRRNSIVDTYNRMYNNYRPLDYKNISDKLSFDSMSESLKSRLYPHQKNGIARFIFGGNVLFAHGVGTGKTFEMIASVMEAKRMGIINKAAMVVPNNKVVDFKNDISQAYPSAKVLVIDTANKKRQTMLGLVNSNDWDIVLIARTTFTKIPVGYDLQIAYTEEQLNALDILISEAENDPTITKRQRKGLQTQRDNLKQKLQDLNSEVNRDTNSVEFEKLGIDCICVDEAHNYKSIVTPTKLNIKGLVNKNNAQLANDMLMKLNYIRSIDGRIIFGTGTPITNTVSEIYNMTRMVRPDILENANIHSLDEWVNTFAQIDNVTEINIDNTIKNKSTQTIRKFLNPKEMVGMFRQFADIVFTEDVVKNLPKAKYIDIEIDGTPEHKAIQDSISSTIKSASTQEMLKFYGKLMAMADVAAVDLRMLAGADSDVNPFKDYSMDELEFEDSKINTMCQKVYDEYTASKKIKGTQIIFCDKGSGSGKVYSFNLHKDIARKLQEKGIPKDEIVIIKNQSDAQLEELYKKVNDGEVRVLIGTSQKMAEGLNVQKRVVAIHHPTVTYKPSDWEQGNARGIRAGNMNDEVRIYRYLQGNTFDSHKWQAQDRKGEMIRNALRGDDIVELEDVGADDEGGADVDAATAMAITSGNPLIKAKIDIDKKVKRLSTLRQNYLNELYGYQDVIAKNPALIQQYSKAVKEMQADLEMLEKYKDSPKLSIKGKSYTKQPEANKALVEAIKNSPKNGKYVEIGEYNGFKIMFKGETGGLDYELLLKGSHTYNIEYAAKGNNIARMAGVFRRIPSDIERFSNSIERLQKDYDFALQEIDKPFEQAKEYEDALAEQKDITYQYEHYGETKNSDNGLNADDSETQYSITESEDINNGRSDLLPEDSGRGLNASTGKQTGRISSYKQEFKGKTKSERQNTATKLRQQGLTEETVNGVHKYELIKPDGYNDDMRSIIQSAKEQGLDVGFFVGEGQRKFDAQRNFLIDAIKMSNNKILLRYDGIYSPQTLLEHERVHIEWETSKMQKAKDLILNNLSPTQKKNILSTERYRAYMTLYKGDTDAVWQEFVADVFADMNDYADDYVDIVADYHSGENLIDRYNPSEYNKITDAGGNANVVDNIGFGNEYSLSKHSNKNDRKYWVPDLSKDKFAALKRYVKIDAKGNKNYITDSSKWLTTDIGGTNVFAIYSVEDIENPTILYEAKGKQGEFEQKCLLDIIDRLEVMKNGESDVRQSSDISRVFADRGLHPKRNDRNNIRSVGRRSSDRDGGVLSGQSRRQPSRAFKNVIQNLFEIQFGTPGVRGGDVTQYALTTADSDEALLTPERRAEIFGDYYNDKVEIQKTPPLKAFGERLSWVGKNISRTFPEIPERGERGTFFAEFRKDMIQWNSLPITASGITQINLDKMTEDLTPDEFKTFTELVYFLDLQEEAQLQREHGHTEILLPHGVTQGEVNAIVKELNEEATENVKQALVKRQEIWDSLKEKYIALNQYIGFDTDNKFKRKNYYHHQVIDYMTNGGSGTGSRNMEIKAGRGWLKERQGSTKAINTDFLAVEYKSLLQMQYDVYIAETLGKIKQQYDIKPQLEQEAFEHNKQMLNEIIRKEATDEDGNLMLNSNGKPDSETYRQQMWYNSKIMFGFNGLFELAKIGELPTYDGEYTSVVKALSNRNLNVDGLYKYVSILAQTDLDNTATDLQEQAVISAKTVMKWTSQKKHWVKEVLGNEYQTWETIAKSMSDTYTIHQPRRGNYFYTKTVIDEDAFFSAQTEMINSLVAGEIAFGDNDVKELFSRYADTLRLVGAAYEQWVLPNEIVKVMNDIANPKQTGNGVALARGIMSAWKGMATSVNPLRTVKFGTRNMVGDLDAVIAGEPRILKYTKQAVQELQQAVVHKNYSDDYMEWLKRGGYSSMLFANEMDTEMQNKLFARLQNAKGKSPASILKLPAKAFEKYYDGVEAAHNFREAILRYSAYLYFKDAINHNNGKVKNYVASNRYIVNGLISTEDKAYQLSKDLLGAYDEVGKFGQVVRRYWVPFYSFTETNVRRYYRMFENIIMSDDKIPKKVGKLLLKALMVNMMYLLFSAWNRLIMKDCDDELPPSTRNVPHITLGKIGDNVYAFRQLGSFSEILEWVGFDDYKWTKDDWTAPIDKAYGMITPFAKMLVEFPTGLNLYPSVTQPRAIRDRWQHFFSSWGVDSIYNTITGEPTRGISEILKNSFIYDYDYKESAYYEILDIKRDFQNKTDNTVYKPDKKANALYYMKTAIRYKDEKAALKYLNKYFEYGGNVKGIKQSISTLNPMYGFTGKTTMQKGKDFIASLSQDEKDKLEIAQAFYENDLMLPDNVLSKLDNNMSEEKAKAVLSAYIKSKCENREATRTRK